MDDSLSKAMLLFCNLEVAARFLENPEESSDFVAFIKEGTWLDDICVNANFENKGCRRQPAQVAELLYDYIIPSHSCTTIKESIMKLIDKEDDTMDEQREPDASNKTNIVTTGSHRSTSSSGRISLDSSKTMNLFMGIRMKPESDNCKRDNCKQHQDFRNDYIDLEHTATQYGLSKYQLLVVLFVILYPLFLSSRAPGRSSKANNKFCFLDMQGRCQCDTPCQERPMSSAEACRAQELLLSTAAYFDYDRMVQVLSANNWLKCCPLAIENSQLGISVCDARDGKTFPIIYANKMLQKLTGYSFKYLLGKTFKILQGEATEAEQIQLMSDALSDKRSIKVALTNYRKNGTTFTNMLVLKPVVDAQNNLCYVVGITCDISRKDATLQELHHADVLVALLPLVLTATNVMD